MKNEITTVLNIKENQVGILRIGNVDYISLTDLAKFKNPDAPADVINKWMSNKDSFGFYGLWEELTNDNFNFAEYREIKINEVGYNAFTMSPSQWKKRTNAIGIIPSSGKYSKGTFAHPDIALEFASWIDTAFKLYLIKEFERLKVNEAYQNKVEWSVRRVLAKTNYRVHTDAIKNNIVPNLVGKKELNYVYANEADIINVALFSKTAKMWREKNLDLDGNMRDYADIRQLIVLSNLENLNATFIKLNMSQNDRLKELNKIAIEQLTLLENDNNVKKIESLDIKNIEVKS